LCEALRHDATARDEWATMAFDKTDLSLDAVQQAYQWLVGNSPSFDDDTAQWSRMFEIVCAATADSRAHKPAVANGKYGFDGGAIKPDCVEVTIRELFEYLLWDEIDAKYDVHRLPTTASKDLVSLYKSNQNTKDTISANEQSVDHLGQKWFSILSDASNCEYLASSPNGKPYELVPTLANVATATQNLWDTTTSCTATDNNVPPWTSLDDLVSAWNSTDRYEFNRPKLHIESSHQTYRAPLGEEMEHKEIALVSLEGSSRAIEMRLDKAHGLSTVTHLRTSTGMGGFDDSAKIAFTKEFFPIRDAMPNNLSDCFMLALAMLGDSGLDYLEEKNCADVAALEAILLTRYKDDRKDTSLLIGTSDKMRRREGVRRAFAESCAVSSRSLQAVCDISTQNKALGEMLLPWILTQLTDDNDIFLNVNMKPKTGIPTSFLIEQLGRIPSKTLEKETVRKAVRLRADGEFILKTLDFRSGRVTLLHALKGVTTKEKLKLITSSFWAN